MERVHLLGAKKSIFAISTPGDSDRPAIVMLNAGVVHRAGPNRLNVKIARRLADIGYPSIRFDISGIGDSRPHETLGYDDAACEDTTICMDFMESVMGVKKFLLIGMCSGADVALRVAATDDRVLGACLIDSFAFETPLYFLAGYLPRLLDTKSWKNLLTGKSDVVSAMRSKVQSKLFGQEENAEEPSEMASEEPWTMPPKEQILTDIQRCANRHVGLYLVFSRGPAFYNYLTNFRLSYQKYLKSKAMETKIFWEADHIFTMTYNQGLLIDALETWAQRTVR